MAVRSKTRDSVETNRRRGLKDKTHFGTRRLVGKYPTKEKAEIGANNYKSLSHIEHVWIEHSPGHQPGVNWLLYVRNKPGVKK